MTSLVLPSQGFIGQIQLLAQTNSDAGQAAMFLGGMLAVIGVICAIAFVATRITHRRRFNSHATLLVGLCQAQGLDRSDQRLLKQVAKLHKLKQPARLFTESRWLNPAALSGTLRAKAEEVTKLREHVFAVAAAADGDDDKS